MDLQELGRVAVPGMRQAGKLILKIQEPSFGAPTEVKNMLLSTNFVEESTLPTFSDGVTGTLSLWRSRDIPPL
jgi:hypothetical protein